MKSEDLGRLNKTFDQFCQVTYKDVQGVICIDSGKQGPVLGITAMTHGNEPSGLAIFNYLLGSKINLHENLLCGKVYLVVNDIEATKKYFEAERMSGSKNKERAEKKEAIRKARYVDVNMNRLPALTMTKLEDRRYEVVRARELSMIWKEFDVALDVHSTTGKSEPMIIVCGEHFDLSLVKGFPIRDVLTRIDEVQIGVPALSFYGSKSTTTAFGIETGQHTDPKSFDRAKRCSVSLLQNLKMLKGTPRGAVVAYSEYEIQSSLVFRDNHFDFVRDFDHKYLAYQGDVLAENCVTGERVRAPFDCHLLMPSSSRGPSKDVSEEMAFLSKPVKEFQV